MTGQNVGDEMLVEYSLGWWAITRYLNRLPIRTIDGTITVSSPWSTVSTLSQQSKNINSPVGFFPEVKPSWGASASICAGVGVPEVDGAGGGTAASTGAGEGECAGDEDEDVGLGLGAGEGEDGGTTGCGKGLPALIAATCAWKVVETIGQPCPGPFRFCSVSLAALKRESNDAVELSSGKLTFTVGL